MTSVDYIDSLEVGKRGPNIRRVEIKFVVPTLKGKVAVQDSGKYRRIKLMTCNYDQY